MNVYFLIYVLFLVFTYIGYMLRHLLLFFDRKKHFLYIKFRCNSTLAHLSSPNLSEGERVLNVQFVRQVINIWV